MCYYSTILLTKTTAALNEAALSYHKVRGLYLVAVVFVRSTKSHYNLIKVYLTVVNYFYEDYISDYIVES